MNLIIQSSSQNPPQPLVYSDQAFDLYLLALARTESKTTLPEAVRQREQVLTAFPRPEQASPDTPDQTTASNEPPAGTVKSKLASLPGFRALAAKTTSSPPGPTTAGAAGLAEFGQQAKPVHVVVEESSGFTARKVGKSVAYNVVYIFCEYARLVSSHVSLALTKPRASRLLDHRLAPT